jgi:hypothetical protein
MSLHILFLILIFSIALSAYLLSDQNNRMSTEAHKLLDSNSDNDNNKFTSALTIPNHTISWAVYQNLDGKNDIEARFYKLNNSQVDSSFYAQIVVPKIDQFVNFTPSIMLLEPKPHVDKDNNIINSDYSTNNNNNNSFPFGIPTNYQIMINQDYNDTLPSSTFYEPFTQTSYWERQEINANLNKLGTYYIVVYNENNSGDNVHTQNSSVVFGKFSLAVGKVEDFSILDFLVLIPYSWINVKLFFNDYLSLALGVSVFVLLVIVLPSLLILRRKRN